MITNERAEILAIQALSWLIEDEELLMPFLAQTGCDLDQFKAGASDPDFLGAVLDFILTQDVWVLSCANEIGCKAEEIVEARHSLSGGQIPEWT